MPRPSSIAKRSVQAPPADAGRYLALCARDARFDGQFFTGVTSTGIYCRPVCAVRTPRRENCRFFDLAAQAEQAGFRPCLRCRPEVAPGQLAWSTQDATALLLQHALRLIASGAEGTAPVAQLAERLGVSDRHLRRIFEARLGITPLQYLQTQRLLTAKHLLTDTTLSATQVALASGFGSVRRFNDAFARQYRLNPTQLRRSSARPSLDGAATMLLRLAYRPPLDTAALLGFFATRQIAGMEQVDASDGAAMLRRTVRMGNGDQACSGWIALRFHAERFHAERFHPERCELLLETSDTLAPQLGAVMRRVRSMLDLDADPAAINERLHADFPEGDGLRVPGAWDGFETAVRTVLGQQITVAAARTLAGRLVARFGEPITTPWPALSHLFPSAAVLAAAPGEALGQLGIVRQRQGAIAALARAVDSGELRLEPGADVEATMSHLRALPGIGDWTAQYIAMRVLRWPDAFPAGDVALQSALGVRQDPRPARAAEAASAAWKPWRSYAVVRAWACGAAP
ncbi:MAG: helix-turn-helix domain-containing protein [Burkholderiaceae bacterium]|nr:helix-turn-helix domain-containing protein [Burkholderiaceae bacterium]